MTIPTLLQRMISVMSEEKARAWLGDGRVLGNGDVVTDPARPTPAGQQGDRWLISGA